MSVLANFLMALVSVFDTLLTLYFWIVIISALLTWVQPDPYNPIVRVLRNLTEPVLHRVRTWLPFVNIGGVDLSPIVVLVGIQFIKIFVVQSLYQAVSGMG